MGMFDVFNPVKTAHPKGPTHAEMEPMRQDFTMVVMVRYPGDGTEDPYDVPYVQQCTAETGEAAIMAVIQRNEEMAGEGTTCDVVAMFAGNHQNLIRNETGEDVDGSVVDESVGAH